MDFILQFHSGMAYLVLLMGIIFIISTLVYAISKKDTDNLIKKIGLITTITFHIQMVLGLINLINFAIKLPDTENLMGNNLIRLKLVEHPLIMISAVIFMTISSSKLKRSKTVQYITPIFAIIGYTLVIYGVFMLVNNNIWPK